MLVCFDATVLCGAIRKPTGINFKLLELAAASVALEGFTSDVAGMEFVRNALDGLGGVSYEIELIDAFLEHFAPLFNPDNVEPSPIGRALPRCTSLHNRPIGEVVYELTGRTHPELLMALPEQLRLVAGQFDPYDVHFAGCADRALRHPSSTGRNDGPGG